MLHHQYSSNLYDLQALFLFFKAQVLSYDLTDSLLTGVVTQLVTRDIKSCKPVISLPTFN